MTYRTLLPEPADIHYQRDLSLNQLRAMLGGYGCSRCTTGLKEPGLEICLRCVVAEEERERHAIQIVRARASLHESDSFITELAGLPEIKRVLRGTP